MPSSQRTAIVGGLLGGEGGAAPGTLLIEGPRIAAVLPALEAAGAPGDLNRAAQAALSGWGVTADAVIDATGLVAFPGAIDLHTHLGEPGSEADETFLTGTRAAICGGVTTVFEHPLSDPPTTTGARYTDKLARLEAGIHANVGLWGGCVPGNVDEMRRQAALGARGFKAFTCPSGTPFPMSDREALEAGMRVAAELGALVLVHCEDPRRFAEPPAGPLSAAGFGASRPPAAELAAVELVLALADETGCRVQIVHVSTAAAVDAILAARASGLPVTYEHTAHHLLLASDDAERLGPVAHAAPALRAAAEREGLWARVAAGAPAIVASDHVPASLADKLAWADDLAGCPLGMQSVQETPSLILDAVVHERRLGVGRAVSMLCAEPARAAGLWPTTGTLLPGADADVVLWDLETSRTLLAAEQQRGMHRWSPYDGRAVRATPVRVLLGGELAAQRGEPIGPPRGRPLT